MAAAKSTTGAGKIDINELEPVKPADLHVIEIGKFAVTKHNEDAGTNFLFVGVVGGFMWSLPGATHYALIIETQDVDGATYLHKAYVIEILVANDLPRQLVWYKY